MELEQLSGIGKARKKSFEENGIFSCEDLISYFPYKYYDFSKTSPYADDGRVKLIKATVYDNAKVVKIRANFSFVTCKMGDENGHEFNAIWYNQPYIKQTLYIGQEIYLYGKNSPTKKNTFIVTLSKSQEKLEKLGLLPVYHSLSGIGQKVLHDSINQVIENQEISSVIPDKLLYKYNLLSLKNAYKMVHNPESNEDIEQASDRIDLENMIPLIAINEYHKSIYKSVKSQKYENSTDTINEFENLLPFRLTPDQKAVIREIEHDMCSKYSMNRLVQGDVGSGKTMVAMFGAYLAAKNGYQAAIIAPTEILAKQHFKTAEKLFGDFFDVTLYTGSTKGTDKHNALTNIRFGKSKIIIGTHSLISDGVVFDNLSYAVVDEQHRFGVEQRAKLKNKGISPDILVMSATPIPRSLSLVLYGDLDISIINSRPKPQNTQTNIVSTSKQDDMWSYIKHKTSNGSKVYVVCPKIDEENDDDDKKRFSAKAMFDSLSKIFNKNELGLIHGKLKKDEQNLIIENFKQGIIKVLVSTTIVEVGVDIPDADIIVVASPESFGLATLHQLRGRVGRQGQESFCFCLADGLNEKSYERVLFFKNHSNGFEIAEFDQKIRGSGSLLGTNQHGKDNGLFTKLNTQTYGKAKEILEFIKLDSSLFAKVLEQGENLYNAKLLNKIVLN